MLPKADPVDEEAAPPDENGEGAGAVLPKADPVDDAAAVLPDENGEGAGAVLPKADPVEEAVAPFDENGEGPGAVLPKADPAEGAAAPPDENGEGAGVALPKPADPAAAVAFWAASKGLATLYFFASLPNISVSRPLYFCRSFSTSPTCCGLCFS